MANVLAAQLAGDTTASFKAEVTATRLKVTGINLLKSGLVQIGGELEEAARASGATRCMGTDPMGTCASVMLGPRVMVMAEFPVVMTLGVAATKSRK